MRLGRVEFSLYSQKPASGSITTFAYGAALDLGRVKLACKEFAQKVRQSRDELWEILSAYESYEVFSDELHRTLDLLENIDENLEYFRIRIGDVAAFLPRNQPLYALTCFALVPALMSTGVHFRVPAAWREFFPEVAEVLGVRRHFPNIYPSFATRTEFLRERLSQLRNVVTGETRPLTEAVIFTGVPKHARQLRSQFDQRTLFISNGAGHNPVVVSETADLEQAAEAIAALCLYNQGQDCAAPNSILVADSVSGRFLDLLRKIVRDTAVGPFRDKACRVGPISDPDDLPRIAQFLARERCWLDVGGSIDFQTGIVAPAIFRKPLREGGNYAEAYAPFIFIQEYSCDQELATYFETAAYFEHAMYVTLYGESPYVRQLVGKELGGRILHRDDTLNFDRHLHEDGVERGTKPYGGYGAGASSLSFLGKAIAMPTLPPRDIFDHLVAPERLHYQFEFDQPGRPTGRWEICFGEVPSSGQAVEAEKRATGRTDPNRAVYIDIEPYLDRQQRFIPVDERRCLSLLRSSNRALLADLDSEGLALLQLVGQLVSGRYAMDFSTFSARLYQAVRGFSAPGGERQRRAAAFQVLYQALFAASTGPKLDHFLWEVDQDMLLHLFRLGSAD